MSGRSGHIGTDKETSIARSQEATIAWPYLTLAGCNLLPFISNSDRKRTMRCLQWSVNGCKRRERCSSVNTVTLIPIDYLTYLVRPSNWSYLGNLYMIVLFMSPKIYRQICMQNEVGKNKFSVPNKRRKSDYQILLTWHDLGFNTPAFVFHISN